MDILGATLLSKEEFKQYEDIIPRTDGDWWLRSPGAFSEYACCVFDYGGYGRYCCYSYGGSVDRVGVGVRPALIISNLDNAKIGDKVEFEGKAFTVISPEYALCDTFIGKCIFRKDWKAEDANIYEASDVKKFVDDWFEKAKNPQITKKTFSVPFAYEMYGRIEVEAESEEEAKRLAEDELINMTTTDMNELSNYLEDSLEIDEDGQILEVQ